MDYHEKLTNSVRESVTNFHREFPNSECQIPLRYKKNDIPSTSPLYLERAIGNIVLIVNNYSSRLLQLPIPVTATAVTFFYVFLRFLAWYIFEYIFGFSSWIMLIIIGNNRNCLQTIIM